jgi:hypothetical protein
MRRYTVLVIGGYGVFGGRLVRLLQRVPDLRVLVAGRSRRAAQRFCRRYGGEPWVFDRDGDLALQLADAAADAVVDAAGPFQLYGQASGRDPYRLARAVLAAGAHYLDLADDPGFVAGITVLDAEAKAAGRTALSGVSSVPAISSAVVERFRRGMTRIEAIESVILPGNRAPRGLSVVRAILAQVGRPLSLWRGGVWQRVPGWSGLTAYQLQAGSRMLEVRDASFIGAPDLLLFPARYGARTVLFRAGLELGVLHLGLTLLGWLPRLRLVRSLAPFARPLRTLAEWLRPFGEDRGGMEVTVIGENAARCRERRQWTLIVEGGLGPFIPAVPAFCWLHHRFRGAEPLPGARACVGELSLEQLAVGFAYLQVVAEQRFTPEPSLFETALGADWPTLSSPLCTLLGVHQQGHFAGEATVENGTHLLARLTRWMMRLPPAAATVPVRVEIEATADRERWTRHFGASRFRSVLCWDEQRRCVTERFGPLRFALGLVAAEGSLAWPVTRGWFLGVPLPRWLLPVSDARESMDAEGRFVFDVSIRLPWVGLVARYRGWLTPGTP